MSRILGLKNTFTQVVDEGALIDLGAVYRKYCKKINCVKTFDVTSNSVALQETGMYLVDVNATFTAEAAGDVTIQLYENGIAIPGALATETITTPTTEARSISFSYIVSVDCGCILNNQTVLSKVLSLVNTGVEATFSNVVVNIVKVL